MADTASFFSEFLPNKIAAKGDDLVKTVKAVIHFEITGAGDWVLNLKNAPASLTEGAPADKPDCKLTIAKADWEALLDKPSDAVAMFMKGKIKTNNIPVATQLQKILA